MPSRAWTSTVSSKLAKATSRRRLTASSGAYSLSDSTFLSASRNFLPCFGIFVLLWCCRGSSPSHSIARTRSVLCDDLYPHTTCGAFYLLDGAVQIDRVQIAHFDLGDLPDLVSSDPTNRCRVR